MPARAPWLLPLALASCSPSAPMAFMEDEGGFFDSPWPSVERVTPRGGPSLQGFPKADEIALLAEYVRLGEEVLDGASTVAPVYFRFDGPLDRALLPDPLGSMQPDATIFLMNVDPDSPGWGARHPLSWDLQDDETAYQPAHLLAMGPLMGAPLDPGTLYAAVITTAVAARNPALDDRLDPAHPHWDAAWEPARRALFEAGLPIEDVAAATVFRTGDPAAELRRVARAVRGSLGVQDLHQELEWVGSSPFFDLYEGRIHLPIWQQGERPYASEGGAFAFDEDGEPVLHAWERVAFSLSIPKNAEMPPEGWPIAIYSHGTGGDHRSCCSTLSSTSGAATLAKVGVAVLGVAQPLHGDRATPGTNVELHTFNFLNPASGRSTFRQGALDSVYLAHVLGGAAQSFVADDGQDILLDDGRLVFFGHSQGGITGAMALPFMGDHVRGAVLSGAGGGFSLTLVYREQGGLDIEALIRELLEFDDDEQLDAHHPAVALVQTLTDVTDPLNYSRAWFAERNALGMPPASVLMTEGLRDEHTPPLTTEALAASAGLPVLEPGAAISEGHVAQGLAKAQPLPAEGNLLGWDGTPVTGGLMQYPEADHFAVFDLDEAAIFYRRFLQSAAEGAPALGR